MVAKQRKIIAGFYSVAVDIVDIALAKDMMSCGLGNGKVH